MVQLSIFHKRMAYSKNVGKKSNICR